MAIEIFNWSKKKPVSIAINVEFGPNGKAMKYALALIDRVHSDGILTKIFANTDDTIAEHGFYERKQNNDPLRIVIKPSGRHPELTCLHEVGHFLDHQSLDVPGAFASENSRLLSGWRQVVEQTQSIKDLRSRKGSLFVTIRLANGITSPVFVDQRHLDYLLMPVEIFARSYAQYITTVSQDKLLLAQIADEINSIEWQAYPLQWTEEDFKPIHDQFELLFRQKGWQK